MSKPLAPQFPVASGVPQGHDRDHEAGRPSPTRWQMASLWLGLLLSPIMALAQPAPVGGAAAPASAPTLQLDASASAQVANDEMVVVLASERDGADVGQLNEQVITALNAAIAEARSITGVQARLGSLATQPVWNREGRPAGWKVRGEVVLVSRELKALGSLAGKLGTRLQIASVSFRLADSTRDAEEKRLIRSAATAFRQRAAEASSAFGFRSYEIREIALNGSRSAPLPRPMFRSAARADAMVAAAPPAVPVEAGESEVQVTVSGTVELKP